MDNIASLIAGSIPDPQPILSANQMQRGILDNRIGLQSLQTGAFKLKEMQDNAAASDSLKVALGGIDFNAPDANTRVQNLLYKSGDFKGGQDFARSNLDMATAQKTAQAAQHAQMMQDAAESATKVYSDPRPETAHAEIDKAVQLGHITPDQAQQAHAQVPNDPAQIKANAFKTLQSLQPPKDVYQQASLQQALGQPQSQPTPQSTQAQPNLSLEDAVNARQNIAKLGNTPQAAQLQQQLDARVASLNPNGETPATALPAAQVPLVQAKINTEPTATRNLDTAALSMQQTNAAPLDVTAQATTPSAQKPPHTPESISAIEAIGSPAAIKIAAQWQHENDQYHADNTVSANTKYATDNKQQPLVITMGGADGKTPIYTPQKDAVGMPAGAKPTSASSFTGDFSKSGQDFLDTVDPEHQAVIKGVLDYSLDPTKTSSMRSGERLQLIAAVKQTDPSFDMAQYPSRFKLRQDFVSGKTSENIVAIDQGLNHIGTLGKLSDALKNGDVKGVNSFVNYVRDQLGNPEVNNQKTAQQAVGTELMRVFRQVNASEVETKAWEERFANANSPAQIYGALQVAAKLLNGRISAINNKWNKGMGTTTGYPDILSSEAQSTLTKYLGESATLGGNAIPPDIQALLKKHGSK